MVGKPFAPVVEQDDAIAQQAPALPGLICHNPCGQVIRCRPFRAPRLVLTHISSAAELNRLDSELEAAVNRNDEAAFTAALHGLLDQVRAHGSALAADTLEPSDLILPPEDASMDEVREMLTEEGLIPG